MDKPSIYLETSLISYAAGRISKDPDIAYHQKKAKEWWKNYRHKYEMSISDLLIDEINEGDPEAAEERQKLIVGLEVLTYNEHVLKLANVYLEMLGLPKKCHEDCIHIAFAVYYGNDFLATCNLRHIANPLHIRKIEDINQELEKQTPVIVTPENLLAFE
jgi:hypothetical protein